MATQFIPTERVVIRADTQGEYTASDNGRRLIKFFIPPSIGYIDTVDFVLRCTIQMNGSVGYARPNPRAGFGSLIRSISIRSGTNNALIEHIDSYNGLCAATLDYTANESISAMRTLTEGFDKGAPGVDTSAQNSLYWSKMAHATGVQTAEKLLVEFPFHYSGVLSGGKTFPVIATGGLRVEILLDEPSRALMPYVPSPVEVKTGADIGKASIGDGTSSAQIDTDYSVTADLGMNGFRIGDIVTMVDDNSNVNTFTVSAVVGTAAGAMKLAFKNNSGAAAPIEQISTGAVITVLPKTAGYKLSDVSLVMNKVAVPESYEKNLMRQVGSSTGFNMDFKTWALVRTTLPAPTGMLSQNIPCVHPEAYSILSVPYDSSKFSGLTDDNFKPDFSGAVSYQYFIDSEAVPNRAVPLNRLSRGIPIPEALHLREQTKALQNADIPVKNLVQCQERSLIARALSAQGQVADLSNGDMRLQTEYTQNKYNLGTFTLTQPQNLYDENYVPNIKFAGGGGGSATVDSNTQITFSSRKAGHLDTGPVTALNTSNYEWRALNGGTPGNSTAPVVTYIFPNFNIPGLDNVAGTVATATVALKNDGDGGSGPTAYDIWKIDTDGFDIVTGGFGYSAATRKIQHQNFSSTGNVNQPNPDITASDVDAPYTPTHKAITAITSTPVLPFSTVPYVVVESTNPGTNAQQKEYPTGATVVLNTGAPAGTVTTKQFDHHISHCAELRIADGLVSVRH